MFLKLYLCFTRARDLAYVNKFETTVPLPTLVF